MSTSNGPIPCLVKTQVTCPGVLPVKESGIRSGGGVVEDERDELAQPREVHFGPREEELRQLLRQELQDALQVAAQLKHDGALALLQLGDLEREETP
jgi:hypothetical protein